MNPPFPRPAEPPIKPQYIVLFKGDDSDFQGNQSVDVVIDTELDTTGMKAHFRFMDFVQDFDSIPENKTLSLVFPNAKTSEFPLGAADATLRFEDASGKFRTVSNRIHIVVTNSVHEAYDNEDSQSITVTVKGTVTWNMIEGKPVFAPVATSGSYNDLTDKPTIPAPVTIDPALSSTSENPVQNKVVKGALDAKLDGAAAYPAWEALPSLPYTDGTIVSYGGRLYKLVDEMWAGVVPPPENENSAWLEVTIDDLKQDTLSSAQMAAVNSGATAEKVATWDGYAMQIAQKANSADVNAALAQKASLSDLPYALVTLSEWQFSGSGYDPSKTYAIVSSYDEVTGYVYVLYIDGVQAFALYTPSPMDVIDYSLYDITATRAYALHDRSVNVVSVTGAMTITLPALVNAGKARDFLVRLEISGSAVPTITFSPDGNESVTYETDGDEFPVPDEAGTWLYSFTETAAHKFAVSLKKVNSVTQGGS